MPARTVLDLALAYRTVLYCEFHSSGLTGELWAFIGFYEKKIRYTSDDLRKAVGLLDFVFRPYLPYVRQSVFSLDSTSASLSGVVVFVFLFPENIDCLFGSKVGWTRDKSKGLFGQKS